MKRETASPKPLKLTCFFPEGREVFYLLSEVHKVFTRNLSVTRMAHDRSFKDLLDYFPAIPKLNESIQYSHYIKKIGKL